MLCRKCCLFCPFCPQKKEQGPRKSPGPGNRGPKGPGFQGIAAEGSSPALPKAVARPKGASFRNFGLFSEGEEARLQYETGS